MANIENFEKEVYMLIKNHGTVDIKRIVELAKKDERIVRKALANLYKDDMIKRYDANNNGTYAHFYYSVTTNPRMRAVHGCHRFETQKEYATKPKRTNKVKEVPKKLEKDGTFRAYTQEDDAKLEAAIGKILGTKKMEGT